MKITFCKGTFFFSHNNRKQHIISSQKGYNSNNQANKRKYFFKAISKVCVTSNR